MENLIEVNGLNKKFCKDLKTSLWYGVKDISLEMVGRSSHRAKLRKKEFWALQDIDFYIKKGELVGLVGPNGAGKTTLLKLLSGLIKPDRGEIRIRGKIQALIALGAGFNPVLTGRENIYINGAILGFSKREMDNLLEEIIEFSEIGEFIDMPVQSYSSGMHVRLGFSVAVNLKPDILIVDEVLAVGDASFKRKARNKMMDLLHSGISVLFVSHNMALVSSLTSRCIYLNKGRMVASGPSDEVTSLYLQDAIGKSLAKQKGEGNHYMASAYIAAPDVFVVKEVKILDSAGRQTDSFHTHDTIRLVFCVEFKEKIEKASFAVGVRDHVDDIIVAYSKFTPQGDAFWGEHELICDITENKFREGIFNFGFYAADYQGGALFKSHNVTSFTILADMSVIQDSGSTQGLVVLDTSWRLT